MNQILAGLKKAAIPAAIGYAIYKYVDNTEVKTAALGVVAVVIAKQLPIFGDAL